MTPATNRWIFYPNCLAPRFTWTAIWSVLALSGAFAPSAPSQTVDPATESAAPSASSPADDGKDRPIETGGVTGDTSSRADNVGAPSSVNNPTSAADEYELMKMFVDALDEVQRNYVEPISRRELMEAAIEGVLAKLDVYSDYIGPEDLDDFRRDIEREFGGIGIQVESVDGQLRVVRPLRGSPGLRAGLKAGDQILEVDGKSALNWDLDQAISQMKGRIGSPVQLKVRHRNGEMETFDIRRDNILLETVTPQTPSANGSPDFMLDDDAKIGYIRVSSFSGHTVEELAAALTQLQARGMRGLVLDLRFNPGGLLTAAISVSDLFLSSGRIVSTSGRNSQERSWEATRPGTFEGFAMAVLVNRYSASASEIVAACLQDHGRAVVVGQRTWGKGSVQKVIELEQGRSALKLTTSSYLRPNGKNIHRFKTSTEEDDWGVSPDEGLEVKLTPEQQWRVWQMQQEAMTPLASDAPLRVEDPQLEKSLSVLRDQLKSDP